MRSSVLLLLVVASLGIESLVAQEAPRRPSQGIQDNSFLVEEAYNQKLGVVQHVLTVRRDINRMAGADDKEWALAFTQEWPVFSETHQLSYTIPYSFLDSGGRSANGFRDVLLNYSWQALYEDEVTPAFAPRASLILPTGDVNDGLGDDTVGYQFNLPLSKVVADHWTLHFNGGLIFLPNVNDRNPVNYHLGGSVIYAWTENFNLMLETIGEWTETVDANRSINRDFEATISPGVRYAFNFSEAQLVVGLGLPIGLTAPTPDYGVLLYLSFEHRFRR